MNLFFAYSIVMYRGCTYGNFCVFRWNSSIWFIIVNRVWLFSLFAHSQLDWISLVDWSSNELQLLQNKNSDDANKFRMQSRSDSLSRQFRLNHPAKRSRRGATENCRPHVDNFIPATRRICDHVMPIKFACSPSTSSECSRWFTINEREESSASNKLNIPSTRPEFVIVHTQHLHSAMYWSHVIFCFANFFHFIILSSLQCIECSFSTTMIR